MFRLHRFTLPALLLLVLGPAGAEPGANSSADHGAATNIEAVHEKSCTSCHGTDVYTRRDRKVMSYEGLARQVRRCETALGLRWFDDEIDAMTAFLNHGYYRFMPDQ